MKSMIDSANSITELHQSLRKEGQTLATIIKELEVAVKDRDTFKRLFHTLQDLDLFLNFLSIDTPIDDSIFEIVIDHFHLLLGDKSLVNKDEWTVEQKNRLFFEFLKIQNFRQHIKTASDLYLFSKSFPVFKTYFKDPTLLEDASNYHIINVINPLIEADELSPIDVSTPARTEEEVVIEAYRMVYSRTLGTDYTKRAVAGLFSQAQGNFPVLPEEVASLIGDYASRITGAAVASVCVAAKRSAGIDLQFPLNTSVAIATEPDSEENNSMSLGS